MRLILNRRYRGKIEKIPLPVQAGTLTYNGKTQSPAWSGYDAAKMTMGGVVSGINAGTFTATFTPKRGYCWQDGSRDAKNVTWRIGKANGSLVLSTTSISLDNSAKTGTITVTRAGNGAITAISSNTSVATVSVSGTTVTVTAVGSGSAVITVKVAEGTNYSAPASKTVNVTVALANVFGVCWNMNSGSTALTRLSPSNDPNGLVSVNIATIPSPAVGTGAGSSPFDNYSPWKGMEEYNIDNNGVVSYKQGQDGFSRATNDTVVYIPTFYYRILDSDGKRYFYISDKEINGFTKHPGSNKYVGRYEGIMQKWNTTVLGSHTADTVSVNGTRKTMRGLANFNGAKVKRGILDYVTWCAIWLLYLVEFADWNSQAKIGQGIVRASAAQKTGGTDTMSYHTGRAAGTDGQTAVQYRHIENLWGNVSEWIDGINFGNGEIYICTDPAKYADDISTGTGYIHIGSEIKSNGWIKSLGLSPAAPYAFFPSAVGGSDGSYISDYCYYNPDWRVLRVGGDWNGMLFAGLFCFDANCTSSNSYSDVGARLLFHPGSWTVGTT